MSKSFDFRDYVGSKPLPHVPDPANMNAALASDPGVRPPVVCDESEGMSVEEQRAWDKANPGKQSAPYPPGRPQDWTSLFDGKGKSASGNERGR